MEIEIKITSTEEAKLKNGTNSFIVYTETTNNKASPIAIKFDEAYFLTSERKQVEQSGWLSSHFGREGKILPFAKVDSALCFDLGMIKTVGDGSRIYITSRVFDSEYRVTHTFTKYENSWKLLDAIEEHDPKWGTEKIFNRYIKGRVERFESLEAELGIEIRNISFSKSEDGGYIGINYEIVSINTGKIPSSIRINWFALDEDGAVIIKDSGAGQISKSEFSGFKMVHDSFSADNLLERLDRVRLMPSRIRMMGD